MRALILLVIVVGLPLAIIAGVFWLPRRRPASDEDVTDRSVTPPRPSGTGPTPSPRRGGDPVPGSGEDRRRHGKP
jgi:hypothetical protein